MIKGFMSLESRMIFHTLGNCKRCLYLSPDANRGGGLSARNGKLGRMGSNPRHSITLSLELLEGL